MENVKELYDIEHSAPDNYTGPTKYDMEFIIGPVANAGLSKMHAAMHTALHHHMGRGHKDRHCCSPNFDPGTRMRSRSLRNSLVYGTRKVRSKGLKVDESIRLMRVKMRSRSIRDSLVYGTRTKRCRHKHCTAWDHQHEWNEQLEKWDIPMAMLHNKKKRETWMEARKSVLDQEMIRRKSLPRNWYGELETDGGLHCGYYLRYVVFKPWDEGPHPHDFYRHTKDIRLDDWRWEPQWYDPELEKIEYHKIKINELWDWHRRRNLRGDMRYYFARVAEARRQRRHFQRLKNRLKQKVILWSELNRNSLWFNPWPEGDQQHELIRRSLLIISKRLSTCAPMWNQYFMDLPTCEWYLNHLDELNPELWARFHYNCKLHKHTALHERRKTIMEFIAARDREPVEEEDVVKMPPLCEPVLALEGFRSEWVALREYWAAIMVERAAQAPPPTQIVEIEEEKEEETKPGKKGKKGKSATKGRKGKSEESASDEESPKPGKGKKGEVGPKIAAGKKGDVARKTASDKKDDAAPQVSPLKKGDVAEKTAQDKRGEAAAKVAQYKKGEQLQSHDHGHNITQEKKAGVTRVQVADAKKREQAHGHDHGKKEKAPGEMFKADAYFRRVCCKPRKKCVKIEPPPLPPQVVFLKKGEGRQSMCKPPLTEEQLNLLPDEDPEPEPVVEYISSKFPIRKRKVRWSIIGGKVPLLPPPGPPLLTQGSAKAALDILDLDLFDAKLEAAKPKVPEKKGKGAKYKKGAKEVVKKQKK